MNQEIRDNEIKQNHSRSCACGCSNAYDQIDDQQFEKAFDLKIISKKHVVLAALICFGLIALLYFLI